MIECLLRVYTHHKGPSMMIDRNSVSCCLLECVLVFVLAIHDASSAEFFVSTKGNDTNPGTRQQPFATLSRSRDAVRTLIERGLHGDVSVTIREGTYHILEPIIFGPQDSGTKEFKISYAAHPGETPIISGGRVISNWKVNDDGTWQTVVPDVASGEWYFRELFVNAQRRPRCQHPNEGYLCVGRVVNNRFSFHFSEGEIPPIDNPGETELILLHDWSISRNRVKSIDTTTHMVETAHEIHGDPHYFRLDSFEPHPRYRLENHPRLLDTPGEWHLDRHSGLLRYLPLPGERPADVQAIAPVATQLLVVRGDATDRTPVRNLHFRGLSFKYCRWFFDQGRYGGIQAGFHRTGAKPPKDSTQAFWQAITPAVLFDFAESCSIRDSRIASLGGSAIWLHRRCRNNAIIGCHIYDIAANGVMLGEKVPPDESIVTRNNEIRNNLIERCGAVFTGAIGVWVGYSSENTIAHNEICYLPYTGVSVGWQWDSALTLCKANMIEHNHIHHVMQVLSDGGGIYTLGRQPGTVLKGNWIHGIPMNAGRAESNGMFLDQGTTDIVIEENVIHDVARSPLRFHRATTNVVRGNLLVHAQDIPSIRYNSTDPANIRQQDNLVVETASMDDQDIAAIIAERCHQAGLEQAYRAKLLIDSGSFDQPNQN